MQNANLGNAVSSIWVRVPAGISSKELKDILGAVAREAGITMNDLVRDCLLENDSIRIKVAAKRRANAKESIK